MIESFMPKIQNIDSLRACFMYLTNDYIKTQNQFLEILAKLPYYIDLLFENFKKIVKFTILGRPKFDS